jgi:hypothetical protein
VAEQIGCLPENLRGLETAPAYPVTVAPALRELAKLVDLHGHE